MMDLDRSTKLEWLEVDAEGGYACGTALGARTRRYHSLLTAMAPPPGGRVTLVKGLLAWIETPEGKFALTPPPLPEWLDDEIGEAAPPAQFTREPWPRWTYRPAEGIEIEHDLFVHAGTPLVAMSWKLTTQRPGVRLLARPLFSFRKAHLLADKNDAFNFTAEIRRERIIWQAYAGAPAAIGFTNAEYRGDHRWAEGVEYEEDRASGLECSEALASPGELAWDLSGGEAILILASDRREVAREAPDVGVVELLKNLRAGERAARSREGSPLERIAPAYVLKHGLSRRILAGYPWYGADLRETFIAVRGLCIATGRLADARRILLDGAAQLKTRLGASGGGNGASASSLRSVDAPLWFIIAVHDYLQAAIATAATLGEDDLKTLCDAVDMILGLYQSGDVGGVRIDDDGLLVAGWPNRAMTWMDAAAEGWSVTPRTGKPVEVQALWVNALRIGGGFDERWVPAYAQARASFRDKFFDEDTSALRDVVDGPEGQAEADSAFRPNQIFAVGGLPFSLVDRERARSIIDQVERRLWTPNGPRTLAPDDPSYQGQCTGDPGERARAGHQGTVWPWLAGPFVEAWVRARGSTAEAKAKAREKFIAPLMEQLDTAGLGHFSEMADGDPPHAPRGCRFHALALAEIIRLERTVLSEPAGAAQELVEQSG